MFPLAKARPLRRVEGVSHHEAGRRRASCLKLAHDEARGGAAHHHVLGKRGIDAPVQLALHLALLGSALLDDALRQATRRGVSRLYLEVRESNEAARAMYAAWGFDTVGRRRGYYERPREDALVLVRDLRTDDQERR